MSSFLARLLATRRGRRALAITLWACYAGVVVVRTAAVPRQVADVAMFVLIAAGFFAYTILARGLGLNRSPLEQPLDERERSERDHAHYVAFQIGNVGMLVAVIYTLVARQVPGLWMPSTPRAGLAALAAVAVAFGVLPATVLAWTLPGDAADDDEEAPAPQPLSRTPLPHRRRMLMAAGGAVFAAAAALGGTGVVPVLASRTYFLLGIAAGMWAGAIFLTRSGDRGRA
jgi:hypothetical protein